MFSVLEMIRGTTWRLLLLSDSSTHTLIYTHTLIHCVCSQIPRTPITDWMWCCCEGREAVERNISRCDPAGRCVCVCVMRPWADRSSQHENRTCDQIRPELSELSVWVTAVNLRVTFNFIMAHVYHWSPLRETLYTGKASAVRENVFNT